MFQKITALKTLLKLGVLSLGFVLLGSANAFSQSCKGQTADYYEQNGFTIGDVRVETRERTLFNFEGNAISKIARALLSNENIDVGRGKPLRSVAVNAAAKFLRDKVANLAQNTRHDFNVPFVLAALECNPSDKTVDIVFNVRLFNDEQYAKAKSAVTDLKSLGSLDSKIRTEAIKDQQVLSDRIELAARETLLKAEEELAKAKSGTDGDKIQKLIKAAATAKAAYDAVKKGYRTIKFINNFRVYPFVSDLDTGGLGFGLSANVRVFPKNPVLERLIVRWKPTGNSPETAVFFKGDRKTNNTFFRNNQWDFGYAYDRNDLVRNDVKLIGANRQREFFGYTGKTKPLGDKDFQFQYGLQYEWVNQLRGGSSNGAVLVENPNPTTKNSNIKFNSLKLAFGTSIDFDQVKLSAKYGFQASTGKSTQMDNFNKHILNIDTAIDLTHEFRTEIGFGAGSLSSTGNRLVPISERFYGNTSFNSFMVTDWEISENPNNRSLKTYDLASANGTNYYGGDGFTSFTTTTYIPIWHKNPFRKAANELTKRGEEILDTFLNSEKAEFEDAETRLQRLYINAQPKIVQFRYKLLNVENDVEDIVKTLKEMGYQITHPQLKEKLNELGTTRGLRVINAIRLLRTIFQSNENLGQQFKDFIGNAIENNSLFQDFVSDLDLLKADVASLKPKNPGAAGDKAIDALKARLNNQIAILKQTAEVARAQYVEIKDYVTQKLVPDTISTVKSPKRLFGYFVKKTDAVNVDGLVYFDASRIRQNSVWSDWKPGLGFGGKLHFFFVDISGGYMWNLTRQTNQDRGSFIFNLNFADLFQ